MIKTRDQLGKFIDEHFGYRPLVGAEVGVQTGVYAKQLLENIRCLERFFCVDAWRHLDGYIDISNVHDQIHEGYYQETRKRLEPWADKIEFIRELSIEGAKRIPDHTLDFVYIDADHAKEAVTKDLNAYLPKMKPGGIMAGHDYLDAIRSYGVFGVKSAVDEFVQTVPHASFGTTQEGHATWIMILN
jgi:hypothetical protein